MTSVGGAEVRGGVRSVPPSGGRTGRCIHQGRKKLVVRKGRGGGSHGFHGFKGRGGSAGSQKEKGGALSSEEEDSTEKR